MALAPQPTGTRVPERDQVTGEIIWRPLAGAAMITVFVTMMMIAVEYLSVLTRGTFQTALIGSRWTQYAAAVLLGAIPGCLGAFTVVALYTHRIVPLGAVVGAMIATSGDEAFVMFSLFPATALWVSLGLVVVGLVVGPLVDLFSRAEYAGEPCLELEVHEEEACQCFPGKAIIGQWLCPSQKRLVLVGLIAAYLTALTMGILGPSEWNWVRVTLLLAGVFGAFVVATVPDHFLDDHLWRHVVLRHVPRLLIWTFGALVAVAMFSRLVNIDQLVYDNLWVVLVLAVFVGIIPESGPHLVFVALFSEGVIPLSVLAASSIVQDGHGMLPLLAESRRDFARIKVANMLAGLTVGFLLLRLGL
jgi:hypothetical protein